MTLSVSAHATVYVLTSELACQVAPCMLPGCRQVPSQRRHVALQELGAAAKERTGAAAVRLLSTLLPGAGSDTEAAEQLEAAAAAVPALAAFLVLDQPANGDSRQPSSAAGKGKHRAAEPHATSTQLPATEKDPVALQLDAMHALLHILPALSEAVRSRPLALSCIVVLWKYSTM